MTLPTAAVPCYRDALEAGRLVLSVKDRDFLIRCCRRTMKARKTEHAKPFEHTVDPLRLCRYAGQLPRVDDTRHTSLSAVRRRKER